MRSFPLIRTEYWNLDTTPPTPRSGATALSESLTDVENYFLPQAQNHAANLYTWGVADGLSVSVVPAQPALTIAPGVALDAAGHLIALAADGVAIVDPTVDPHEVRNIPTVLVGLDGLTLSTAGLSGEYFLTLTWREVFRAGPLGTAPILLHAPWARLRGVAGFPDTGDQVILARVSLAATGLVTALAAAGRRLVGLPASRLELRCPRTTLTPSLRVDHVPTAELRARPDGGLDLNLLPPSGSPRPVLSVEGLNGSLALVPQGGNVGIGTPTPTRALTIQGTAATFLNVRSLTGGLCEIQLGADTSGGLLSVMTNHDLQFRTGGDNTRLVIKPTGHVGIGTTSPSAKLVVHDATVAELRVDGQAGAVGLTLGADANHPWIGSRTNHSLRIFTNGTEKLRVLADGKVGLGTATPTHPLDIKGAVRLRATPQTNLLITQQANVPDTIAIDFIKDTNLTPSARILFDGVTEPAVHRASLSFFTRGAANPDVVERVRITEDGNVGIGTTTPTQKLDVAGTVKATAFQGNTLEVSGNIRAGNSDLYFTNTAHNHTGIGNTPGFAAIENAVDYGALLILGRAGTARGRYVRLWDYLQINGGMEVIGSATISGGLGVTGSATIGGALSVNGSAAIGGNVAYGGWQNKLDVAIGSVANVRCTELRLGYTAQPRRALVDREDVLVLNYGGDWPAGVRHWGPFSAWSSRALKENIADVSVVEALDALAGLQPVTFNFKADERKVLQLGFIAEDVPMAVGTPDRQGVVTSHIVTILTKVVQEQQTLMTQLTDEVKRLEALIIPGAS